MVRYYDTTSEEEIMIHKCTETRCVRPARAWVLVLLAALVVSVPLRAEAMQDRFKEARALAFSGERDAAREMLVALLEQRPNHWDARILYGRLFAWDKRYEEAREQLMIVIRAKPDYADARNAIADVELWSDNPERALWFLEGGLSTKPTHQDFLYKKAVAQRKLGDHAGAASTLDQLYTINPAHERAAKLFASLRLERMRHKVGVSYGFTDVDTLHDPWHAGSVQLSRRTGIGTVVARLNYANRFDDNATQYELDAYPKIADGLYAYVNYGYSSSSRLYPNHRYATELYANLPHGIEISAGFRRLEFNSSTVTIYTGTLAKYYGSWWFSFRPYITPKDIGTSRSYSLTIRRYFGDADTYLGITGGKGSSPGEVRDVNDLIQLDSWKVGMKFQKKIADVFILKLSGRYGWEELFNGRERRQFDLGVGFERRF